MTHYRLNKVSQHDHCVQRKRWVTTESGTSYWHDEFHSMHTSTINYNFGRKDKQYGVSKKEFKASRSVWLVNPLRGEVFGG